MLTVGRTVAEAFVLMMLLERAAQIQLTAMAATGGRVALVSDAVAERTLQQWMGDGTAPEGQDEWPAHCCAACCLPMPTTEIDRTPTTGSHHAHHPRRALRGPHR